MKTRLLLLLCLLLASPLAAQQRGQVPRPMQADRRAQLELQLLQRFTQRAANELRLDANQRQRLAVIVRGTAAERRRLNQSGMDLRRRMVLAVRDAGTDQAVFERLLQEQRAFRERDAELWSREQAQLAEVLNPRQQVHFSMLWLRLQEEARNLLLQRGPGLAPPPGDPPPP